MGCYSTPLFFPLCFSVFFFSFNFFFYCRIIALQYHVGFMPYIDMNQPQVDVCLLPPEPPPISLLIPPSRLSQSTGLSSLCHSKFPLATCFTYDSIYVSMLFSQFVPSLLPRLCPQVCALYLHLLAALQISSSVPSF